MVTSIRQAAKVRRKGSKEEPGWKKSLELKWGEVRTFEQNWKSGGGGGEPFLAGAKALGLEQQGSQ